MSVALYLAAKDVCVVSYCNIKINDIIYRTMHIIYTLLEKRCHSSTFRGACSNVYIRHPRVHKS